MHLAARGQVRRFAYVLFGAGVALLGEHLVAYGELEWSLLCHGTYGIVAIVAALVLLYLGRDATQE